MPPQEHLDQSQFPMRLNRFMALKGLATRRRADELIAAGLVSIDGRQAVIGTRVERPDQVVVLAKNLKALNERLVYYAYHKPRGIITHSPQRGERSIETTSGLRGVFPVGRLDKDSEGLIILTNDGRVTERLLHPRFEHEKEYEVTVREPLPRDLAATLMRGVEDGGERLTAKAVEPQGKHQLRVILTEGKKHQLRRMLAHTGLTVTELRRVRIMGVHLGALKPGQHRVLSATAKAAFLRDIGLE